MCELLEMDYPTLLRRLLVPKKISGQWRGRFLLFPIDVANDIVQKVAAAQQDGSWWDDSPSQRKRSKAASSNQ